MLFFGCFSQYSSWSRLKDNYAQNEFMIYVVYWKREETCAICKKAIAKYSAAMYDEHKSKDKRFVHLKCWEDLQRSRGIKLEEPPF